jgi:LysM repeat protein
MGSAGHSFPDSLAKGSHGIIHDRQMSKATISIFCASLAVTLTACGVVVTPQPTPGPSPTSTPLPGHTPVIGPAGTAPALPLADTATPTVSPTPIVYVIQSGDTLLEIAQEYGVSVEAIQRANGIEDPRYLRVGQEVLIPTGEEEDAEIASGNLLIPTPTPIPFDVLGVACYETPVGSLWCLGEVVNTTATSVTNVQMLVTLYDAGGQRVAQADTFIAADLIPPGERSPFGVLFVDPPPGQVVPQVTLVRGQIAGDLAASYVSVSAIETQGRPSGPQFEVSGLVQNDGALAAGSVSVIVTIYDAEGLVTGFRHASVALEAPLAPGETAPFSLLLNFHGDAPADFSVIALGHLPG